MKSTPPTWGERSQQRPEAQNATDLSLRLESGAVTRARRTRESVDELVEIDQSSLDGLEAF